jgi:superfamily II DNA or RNA helicase
VFDDLLEGDNMMTLIAAGVLAKPRVFSVPESELPVLTAVKKVMGDFEVKSLSQAVRQGVVIGKLVDHWFQRAANRPTIAFTVDVRHSKILAKRFRQRGVTCEHIDGTTPPEERAAILHRLATGKTKIVTNCMILCEGLDLASVKCVILARPTTSLTLYLQQCGRILRPHHRHDPMILDHSGNVVVMKHGLPHDEREVSLFTKTTPEKDHVDGGPSKVTCLSCGLVYSSSELECSNCGQENPRVRKQKEADIELVEMEKAMKAEKDALYKRALKEAKAQGAKRPEAFARVVVEANYA